MGRRHPHQNSSARPYDDEAPDGRRDPYDDAREDDDRSQPAKPAGEEDSFEGFLRFGMEVKIGLAVLVALLIALGIVLWRNSKGEATAAAEAPAADSAPKAEASQAGPKEVVASDPRTNPASRKTTSGFSALQFPEPSEGGRASRPEANRPSFMPSREAVAAAAAPATSDRLATGDALHANPPSAGGPATTAPAAPADPFDLTRPNPFREPLAPAAAGPAATRLAFEPLDRRETAPAASSTAPAASPSAPSATAPSVALREPARVAPAATPPVVVSPPPSAARNEMAVAAPNVRLSGGRLYTVREGDTLYDIARNELGKASRWSEIYDLNAERLGNCLDALPAGAQIVLPEDHNAATALGRAGGSTYQR